MFKKLPLSLLLAFFALATYGQTIVSTTPENRKIILEEYTGIHCVYCPDGHAIAQGIQNANPGQVFLINIHQGGYATPGNNEPDFRTPYGNALAAQTGLAGYPAATVNRQNFPGREQGANGTTAMNRNYWSYAANQVMGENSYLNMAVTANIVASTNVMTIHVEGYYTGTSPESTNLLNVAILQNNTKGPQTGGNAGNNYNHMHRLIDMITGQWGEEITTTSSGTFFERDYTYEIIPQNNFVPVEIGELEVVVFMTETHQKVISGNGTMPTISVTNTNDANVRYLEPIKTGCLGTDFSVTPKVNIQNTGSSPISSLEIGYTMNGTAGTYSWTGTLASLESTTISLPESTLTIQETNTIEVSVPSDDNNSNNEQTISFGSAPSGTGTINMVLKTDTYGGECRWRLQDSSGTVLFSGGPYANGSRHTITERFDLDVAGCYSFTIIDTYGDGGTSVTLTDSDGTQIYRTTGDFGANEKTDFASNGILGIAQSTLENVSIYPNPAHDILNVLNAETADIQVYDMLGRTILSKGNISLNEQLNVSSLNAGTYFMKITKEGVTSTKKFVVVK